MSKVCLNESCSNPVNGRKDRKFCSEYCKTDYHYRQRKKSGKEFFKKQIDDILRTNRKILHDYNQAGKTTVRKEELLKKGFNPRFITHYFKTQQGDTYLFCYDQGFKEVRDNNKDKFLLVLWQEYMSKQML
ncbi:hypothetical protein K6119_10605 [Paracrocinitomix mangrovi]|uniref:hypothetical protein n=1 Tax=Paracrocinitomix mangrovi TaxID=2862509 RepID=UPI001C8D4DFD|nr:hypothetical protein [Paracrocinitomix mangrovi]UKN00182.1 hypothetical protein K6119_10605 [Paracrocinitomix mangrovi]